MDNGDVRFDVDLASGIVRVSVRPPLGMEAARVTTTVTVLDFLDKAAQITLALNKTQRDMMAQLGARPA